MKYSCLALVTLDVDSVKGAFTYDERALMTFLQRQMCANVSTDHLPAGAFIESISVTSCVPITSEESPR